MGVVSRKWVWVGLVGVVVRRYIDFLIILLIPTTLVFAHISAESLLFVHFLNVFRSLIITATTVSIAQYYFSKLKACSFYHVFSLLIAKH